MIEINGTPIDRPYIIAEACNNFNNNLSRAEHIIELAKLTGCNAVKFQMRLQEDRLTPDQHRGLQEKCNEMDITYLCTAFDLEGARILRDMAVSGIKISSGGMTNKELIREVMTYDIPILISTGMSTVQEIEENIPVNAIVMQSTSIYPCPYKRVNLAFIADLYERYNYVGLSDHTPTIYTAIASVAFGARVIEKHFTLNKAQPGPDQSSSLEYLDLKKLVEGCHAVFEACGAEKDIFPEERDKAKEHKHGYFVQ